MTAPPPRRRAAGDLPGRGDQRRAACFGRASPRALRRLTTNRLFGRYLREYPEGRRASRATKAVSLAALWLGLAAGAFAARPPLFVLVGLLGVGLLGVGLLGVGLLGVGLTVSAYLRSLRPTEITHVRHP